MNTNQEDISRMMNVNRREQRAGVALLWRLSIVLVLFLFAGLCGQGNAQTLLCGDIWGTATPAGNPYILTCDGRVPTNKTLILEPGVIVWIGSNVTLTVLGHVEAVGTPTSHITIQAPGNSHYWRTIALVNAAGTNRFEYCDFLNAHTAISLRVAAEYGLSRGLNTRILNCTFSNCVGEAIYGEATGFAAYLHWQFATNNVLIQNCDFSSLSNGCVMKASGAANGGQFGYGYVKPIIRANVFQDLTGTALLLATGYYAGPSQPLYANNTVVNCRVGVDSVDPLDARVVDNIFVGATNAVKVSGSLSRYVGYNDFYQNTANFTGYEATYGQVAIANRNGTPCDILYNIFEDPRLDATNDSYLFYLAADSPCIDAGSPDATFADVCFPPSHGNSYPDLGAYGGPEACGWPSPPIRILRQPESVATCLGQSVTFIVRATGAEPLSYQWFLNGSPIGGQTNSALALTNLQADQAGSYTVVITNVYDSVTSSNALLTLSDACVDICRYAGLSISGLPGRNYELRYTTDLINTNFSAWPLLAIVTAPCLYFDTNSCASPKRFYGVKLVP